MTPNQFLEFFFLQREEIHLILDPLLVANLDSLACAKPKPSAAQAFAEWLLLCPDVEQAQAHTRLDQSGARAFLTFADQISEIAAAKLSGEAARKYSDKQTPFFALAGFVLDFLERTKAGHPEEWE